MPAKQSGNSSPRIPGRLKNRFPSPGLAHRPHPMQNAGMLRRNARAQFVMVCLIVALILLFVVRRLRAQDRVQQVESGGQTRTYLVHLPKNYDRAKHWPVVFVLHGGGGRGQGMDVLTHFDDFADRNGIIGVFPDGITSGWNDGRVAPRLAVHTADDVAFISALLDKLESEYSIDSARVYATGISNGGFMSFRLGCELAPRIAAVAPVASTLSNDLAKTCHPARPVPMLMINGTADPLVPYQGGNVFNDGGAIFSAEASAQKWAQMNGCPSGPVTTTIPSKTNGGLPTKIFKYSGCKSGADVELHAIERGGHTWPGGFQYLPESLIGKTSREFDANEVIWKFFSTHPQPAK
jgi:polyhydroxybutyrate depolymerase